MVDANSSPPVSIRRLSATQSVQDRLDHLVQSHPQQAIVEAQSLLQASPHDPPTLLAGWPAIGRALFELGDMRGASEAMRHALREGAATQSAERLTSVRVSA